MRRNDAIGAPLTKGGRFCGAKTGGIADVQAFG